jgi:hypothetical protein
MQLGFDYNYSHSKVKFNVNWIDNIIIQRISLFNTNIFCLGTSNDILFPNNIFMTFFKDGKKVIKGVLSIHLCDRNLFMQIWVRVFVFQLFFFCSMYLDLSCIILWWSDSFVIYMNILIMVAFVGWPYVILWSCPKCCTIAVVKDQWSMIYLLGVTRNDIHGIF